MERLTTKRKDGRWALKNNDGAAPRERINKIPLAIDRLAAYEDRGLEPEEVTAIKHALMGQEIAKITEFDGISVKRMIELVQAEKDGRLVVLPKIKKYATIYWIWGNEIMPVRYWGIRGGCVGKDGKYHATCEMRTKRDRIFHHNTRRECTIKAGDRRYFYVDDIGKTVFLTREKAEAALKKREEAENGPD